LLNKELHRRLLLTFFAIQIIAQTFVGSAQAKHDTQRQS